MPNRTKIAIADDHKIFAEGIRSVLKEQEWINWVGEAFNIREAIQLYIGRRPDIYLLDYHFPDGTGYQVAEKILSQFPEAKIIIIHKPIIAINLSFSSIAFSNPSANNIHRKG